MFAQHSTGLDELIHRPRPSAWERFVRAPSRFLAAQLYSYHRRHRVLIPAPARDAVNVVCISDTHNSQPSLPDGDILIHAGDLTQSGSTQELAAALKWLRAQPHAHKIIIAGNHDKLLDPSRDDGVGGSTDARASLDWGDITYLQDSSATVTCANGRRLHIYGSPWSPRHGSWAFQYPQADNVWEGVTPGGTDILVTHAPPAAHLDANALGCQYLLREVWRAQPRLHIFGHVHDRYGREWLAFDEMQNIYENMVIAGGGMWNLLRMASEFVKLRLRPNLEAACLLVNPSMVGGLRDNERREPIKVYI